MAVTNENLLELRQFQPNEAVMVTITAQQVNMMELLGTRPKSMPDECRNIYEEELLIKDDGEDSEGQVTKEWKFDV
ncbi:hypothetical protein [Neomoorella thermoacetica]|uniref:hypothetical protein n=1 Tax=Neomoorella thermoacetica TaxID=1525 RepID=UPI00091BF5B2|nr:hypothetical protein [Moorella thermoacetica]OIQ10366.1 hypothetical protein MOOTH_27380 [Moorella thermoacetica]